LQSTLNFLKPPKVSTEQELIKTALIVYWSKTGNTQKVANVIKQGLEEAKVQVTIKKQEEAENVAYFDYDLVCMGSPSYSWHPPEPMASFLNSKFAAYRTEDKIKPGAPKVPGENALIFVSYSGSHTGIDEATLAGKYMRHFFERLGFTVLMNGISLASFTALLRTARKVGWAI
jgi:flavorubredoxin